MTVKKIDCDCGCQKPKKETGTCTRCVGRFCHSHLYSYVDESNAAITRNSPPYCKQCYPI